MSRPPRLSFLGGGTLLSWCVAALYGGTVCGLVWCEPARPPRPSLREGGPSGGSALFRWWCGAVCRVVRCDLARPSSRSPGWSFATSACGVPGHVGQVSDLLFVVFGCLVYWWCCTHCFHGDTAVLCTSACCSTVLVCGVAAVHGTAVHLYCGRAQLCWVQGGTVVRSWTFPIRDVLCFLTPVRPAFGKSFSRLPGGRGRGAGGRFGDTVHCTVSWLHNSHSFTAVLKYCYTVVLLYTACLAARWCAFAGFLPRDVLPLSFLLASP